MKPSEAMKYGLMKEPKPRVTEGCLFERHSNPDWVLCCGAGLILLGASNLSIVEAAQTFESLNLSALKTEFKRLGVVVPAGGSFLCPACPGRGAKVFPEILMLVLHLNDSHRLGFEEQIKALETIGL